MLSTQSRTTSRRNLPQVVSLLVSTLVSLALGAGVVVGATAPARAAGCTAGILCGWVFATSGSVSVRVGEGWNGTAPTGRTAYVSRGSFSPAWVDWDAYYVPAGHCARAFRPAGKGAVQLGTTNRIGMGGKWVKVDNLGAHVVLKAGACA